MYFSKAYFRSMKVSLINAEQTDANGQFLGIYSIGLPQLFNRLSYSNSGFTAVSTGAVSLFCRCNKAIKINTGKPMMLAAMKKLT